MFYIVEDDILQLIDLNVKGGNANFAASDTIFQKSRTMILASLGGGLILSFLLSMLMMRVKSEEHTSELQSLMRISYAVFCLNNKHNITTNNQHHILKFHS